MLTAILHHKLALVHTIVAGRSSAGEFEPAGISQASWPRRTAAKWRTVLSKASGRGMAAGNIHRSSTRLAEETCGGFAMFCVWRAKFQTILEQDLVYKMKGLIFEFAKPAVTMYAGMQINHLQQLLGAACHRRSAQVSGLGSDFYIRWVTVLL